MGALVGAMEGSRIAMEGSRDAMRNQLFEVRGMRQDLRSMMEESARRGEEVRRIRDRQATTLESLASVSMTSVAPDEGRVSEYGDESSAEAESPVQEVAKKTPTKKGKSRANE